VSCTRISFTSDILLLINFQYQCESYVLHKTNVQYGKHVCMSKECGPLVKAVDFQVYTSYS